MKCYCEFIFLSIYLFYFTFYFILVYFSNFRGSKNRGSMDLVHESGPWTRSTFWWTWYGPGVHVLYFPISDCNLGFLQWHSLVETPHQYGTSAGAKKDTIVEKWPLVKVLTVIYFAVFCLLIHRLVLLKLFTFQRTKKQADKKAMALSVFHMKSLYLIPLVYWMVSHYMEEQ